MKYRQWKKNYKKKHGYNPTFMEDKRKQCKAMRAVVKALPKGMENLAKAFSNMGQAFMQVAEKMRGIKLPRYCKNVDCISSTLLSYNQELAEKAKRETMGSEVV